MRRGTGRANRHGGKRRRRGRASRMRARRGRGPSRARVRTEAAGGTGPARREERLAGRGGCIPSLGPRRRDRAAAETPGLGRSAPQGLRHRRTRVSPLWGPHEAPCGDPPAGGNERDPGVPGSPCARTADRGGPSGGGSRRLLGSRLRRRGRLTGRRNSGGGSVPSPRKVAVCPRRARTAREAAGRAQRTPLDPPHRVDPRSIPEGS